MRVQSFRLQKVEFMPKVLDSGILYVAEEYGSAAHLCACGCGEKVRTPLSPTEWRLTVQEGLPTLTPSIGNWQKPCRSHYWIQAGKVAWAGAWSKEQVEAGRRAEVARAEAYFETTSREKPVEKGFFRRLWDTIRSLFGG